jgi:hypothetical protein
LRGIILKQSGKSISIAYYSYDDIPLKLFVEIAQTGNVARLCVSGLPTEEELVNRWEDIIQKNSKANGDNTLSNYTLELEEYNFMLLEYNTANACIVKLMLCLLAGEPKDDEAIESLNSFGYGIRDTGSRDEYVESINAAVRRANNVLTRIKVKLNQIRADFETKGTEQSQSVEEMIGIVSAAIGYEISGDVTLSRFNSYKKIIRQRRVKKEKVYE